MELIHYLSQKVENTGFKNIKYYEDLLCEYDFVRCHQSYLVAKSHIKVLKTHSLLLTDGSEIPISHRKRKLFNNF
jgi:two-component system LytT family response regulator